MRTFIVLLFVVTTISACNGQSSQAVKDQQTVMTQFEDMKAKRLMAATDGGPTMTCLIDGKPWAASGLYPISMSERIGGVLKEAYISFPVPTLRAGFIHKFSDHYVVDFAPANTPGFWGGETGQMEITKVDGNWVEGKFFFTATGSSSTRKIEVTNGFFRVAQKKQ